MLNAKIIRNGLKNFLDDKYKWKWQEPVFDSRLRQNNLVLKTPIQIESFEKALKSVFKAKNDQQCNLSTYLLSYLCPPPKKKWKKKRAPSFFSLSPLFSNFFYLKVIMGTLLPHRKVFFNLSRPLHILPRFFPFDNSFDLWIETMPWGNIKACILDTALKEKLIASFISKPIMSIKAIIYPLPHYSPS